MKKLALICFFFAITKCQIVRSDMYVLTHLIKYKFMCLSS